MPNYCDYEIRAIGTKESIEEFVKVFKDKENGGSEHFLARTWVNGIDCKDLQDKYKATIWGYCAWSVCSCMLDIANGYYRDWKKTEPNITTLEQLSEKHKLTIEVYSEECGCAFSEHYLIRNGIILLNESFKFTEICYSDEIDLDSSDEEISKWLADNIKTFKEFGHGDITVEKLRELMNEYDDDIPLREQEWDFMI